MAKSGPNSWGFPPSRPKCRVCLRPGGGGQIERHQSAIALHHRRARIDRAQCPAGVDVAQANPHRDFRSFVEENPDPLVLADNRAHQPRFRFRSSVRRELRTQPTSHRSARARRIDGFIKGIYALLSPTPLSDSDALDAPACREPSRGRVNKSIIARQKQ